MEAAIEVVLGVDIGGTNTAFGLVDRTGRCLARGSMPTNSRQTPAQFFRRLRDQAAALEDGLERPHALAGIGVAGPNANHFTGTIEHPGNLRWEFVDIPAELARFYAVPVAVTNDANAAALGELLFGAGRGLRDFIVLTLGTGLGSGIVVNGDLVYGAGGVAGELGHLRVEGRAPRDCGCGLTGCLETYVSATGLVRTAVELMALRRDPSVLRRMPVDRLTSLAVCEAARQGDRLALEAFEVTGRILGAKLADMVAFTQPEAIILFGGLAAASDLFLETARTVMEENLTALFKGQVKLLTSGMAGADAAILGAGALVWNELRRPGNPAPAACTGPGAR